MRRLIAKIPFLHRLLRRLAFACRRVVGTRRLRKALAGGSPWRIVIGASGVFEPGWIPTDIHVINLLVPVDWDRFFKPGSIDAILAEHVWEHLTEQEGRIAALTCFKYLKPGGYLRVAVPDGFHPDPRYVDCVRIGGSGCGADDHKVLYTHETFERLFVDVGFEVVLYEHFDRTGEFHFREWDPEDGRVWRSKRFDERNTGGTLTYTSIVLDAIKR